MERDSTATLNYSLNRDAADQTRSRPRRLHCGFDLAAPSHYHDNSDRFSFSFAGQQALKDTVENARVREYADTENEQLSIFLRFRGPKALSDRVESRESPTESKGFNAWVAATLRFHLVATPATFMRFRGP